MKLKLLAFAAISLLLMAQAPLSDDDAVIAEAMDACAPYRLVILKPNPPSRYAQGWQQCDAIEEEWKARDLGTKTGATRAAEHKSKIDKGLGRIKVKK